MYAGRLADWMREGLEIQVARMLGRKDVNPGQLITVFEDSRYVKLIIKEVALGPGFQREFEKVLGRHLAEKYPVRESLSLMIQDPVGKKLIYRITPIEISTDLGTYRALKEGKDLFK